MGRTDCETHDCKNSNHNVKLLVIRILLPKYLVEKFILLVIININVRQYNYFLIHATS